MYTLQSRQRYYTINGGVDELTGETIIEDIKPIKDEVLDFETISYKNMMTEIARVYSGAMNIIHYMHDKCL